VTVLVQRRRQTGVVMLVAAVAVAACLASAAAAAQPHFAGLTVEQARMQAVHLLRLKDPSSPLLIGGANESYDPRSGRNAWAVWFHKQSGWGSGYLCSAYVWRGSGWVERSCWTWRR
jgi:hypothetical protein